MVVTVPREAREDDDVRTDGTGSGGADSATHGTSEVRG